MTAKLFQQEHETEVRLEGDRLILAQERGSTCPDCGVETGREFVSFSAQRARDVANELLRLADEIDRV